METEASTNFRRPIIGQASVYREDKNAIYTQVKCSSAIHDTNGSTYTYNIPPLTRKRLNDPNVWNKSTTIACWHCCHKFDTCAIYAPHAQLEDGTFAVYGNFCSLACCKTYIMEKNAFSCSMQLLLLARIARDVHSIFDFIEPAPPRVCLQLFGGDLTIDDFRAKSRDCISIYTVEPPFVSHVIMTEQTSRHGSGTRKGGGDVEEVQLQFYPESEGDDDEGLLSDEEGGGGEIENEIANPEHNFTWDVKGLKRPQTPLILPRAPGNSDQPSLLEKYVQSRTEDTDWEGVPQNSGAVAAPTPSVTQVDLASKGGKKGRKRSNKHPGEVQMHSLSGSDGVQTRTKRYGGLGRFMADSDDE